MEAKKAFAYHTNFFPRVRRHLQAVSSPLQTSRRDIFLLACCQALLLVNASGLISMNGLVGFSLASNKTLATFASFFPASDPKYVLVIALDEPTAVINDTAFRTAGLTAAPVLGHAIRRLAPVMGMRPLPPAEEDAPLLYTLAGND